MLGLFKRKKRNSSETPLVDLDQNPIMIGDHVESFRYDMGLCEVIPDEHGKIQYQSIKTGKIVRWQLMIDASTGFQKVRKKES